MRPTLKLTSVPAVLATTVLAAFVASSALAADNKSGGAATDAAKRELAALQGRWAWNGSGATGPGNYADTRKFLEGGRTKCRVRDETRGE